MDPSYIPPREQSKMALNEIIKDHSDLYSRTKNLSGVDLAREIVPVMRDVMLKYKEMFYKKDQKLANAVMDYWLSVYKIHSRVN